MLAFSYRRSTALAILACLVLVCRVASASPRDELLRYVPEDVGFCLVVQNMRGQSIDFLASPFALAWSKSAFAGTIAGAPEFKQVQMLEQYLSKQLGVGWTALRDDLLGDAFGFAYRPGPSGKPEREQGMFFVRPARSDRTLASFVQKLNDLQKRTGEVKELVDCEHKGVKYVRRVESKSTNYYLVRGSVLVYSGQETFLQQAIECDKALAASAPSPLARRFEELGLNSALVGLALNPRVLDEAVTGKSINDPAAKTIATCWKALQGVGVGVHLERDLRIALTIKARMDQLPAPARRFLTSAVPASEVWPAFPDNALFAAAGRLDVAALYDLLGEFLSRTSKQALAADLERGLGAVLGKDVIKEVLPALGPDWGVCVTAPPSRSKHWAPQMLVALRVAPGEADDPVDRVLLNSVHLWAQMAVLGHNKTAPDRPIILRTRTHDRVKIRYLQGDSTFPPGIQPAFALKSGYLVLGSSPDEVRRFKAGPATVPGGAVPLLRISLKDLRIYLKERADGLAAELARKENTTKEKALEKIDGLRMSLELFDRIELSHKAAPGLYTLTLGVQMAQPLKK